MCSGLRYALELCVSTTDAIRLNIRLVSFAFTYPVLTIFVQIRWCGESLFQIRRTCYRRGSIRDVRHGLYIRYQLSHLSLCHVSMTYLIGSCHCCGKRRAYRGQRCRDRDSVFPQHFCSHLRKHSELFVCIETLRPNRCCQRPVCVEDGIVRKIRAAIAMSFLATVCLGFTFQVNLLHTLLILCLWRGNFLLEGLSAVVFHGEEETTTTDWGKRSTCTQQISCGWRRNCAIMKLVLLITISFEHLFVA